jgi:hypothetical protein
MLKQAKQCRRVADLRRARDQREDVASLEVEVGLEVSDAKRLHGLEDEDLRLEQLVAERSLDIHPLKALHEPRPVSIGGRAPVEQSPFGLVRPIQSEELLYSPVRNVERTNSFSAASSIVTRLPPSTVASA